MTANPQPPPEARLIAAKRAAIIPALSARQAASRAGFSVALWTKIEKGYDQVARGVTIPFRGTAERVARAAQVVGATAGELSTAGRPDAAHVLAALPPLETTGDPLEELREIIRMQEKRLRRLEGLDTEEDEPNGHRNAG